MSFFSNLMSRFEAHGKVRTMAVLRRMPEEQLRDIGISPALLSRGVQAWPWRQEDDVDMLALSQFPARLAAVKVADVSESEPAAVENSAAEEQHKSAA